MSATEGVTGPAGSDPVRPRDGAADSRWTERTLLVILVAAAAILRFWPLGTEGIWRDEAATWMQISGTLGEVITRTAQDTYPPGYNLLAWLSLHVFGATEVGLRFPAAVLGTLAVPACYWLGRLTGGRTAALLAALLTAFSPFAIYYSQEARPYALLLLASALHLALLIRTIARRSPWIAVGLAISAAILLYSHPYGGFAWLSAVIGFAIALIVHAPARRAVWPILIAEIVAAGSFLPWATVLLNVQNRLAKSGFWIPRPNVFDLAYALKTLASGYLLLAGLIVLIIIGLWPRSRSSSVGDAVPLAVGLPLLVAAIVGPVALGFIISQFTTPIFIARYSICVLPVVFCLAAIGASRLASTPARRTAVTGVIALFCCLSFWTDVTHHDENWRGLVAQIRFASAPGDCLVSDPNTQSSLRFYLHRLPECYVASIRPTTIAAAVSGHTRIFVSGIRNQEARVQQLQKLLPGSWRIHTQNYGGRAVLTVLERTAGSP